MGNISIDELPICNPRKCLEEKSGSSSEWLFNWEPYFCYTIQGVLFSIANCLVVGTIAKHPGLRWRKEYVAVAALAVADVINEIAFAEAGIFRMYKTLNGDEAKECKTSWQCMWSFHGIVWSLSFPLVYFMLLAISIDRLICVTRPLDYKTYSVRYSFNLITFFYFLALVVSGVSIYMSHWNAVWYKCDTFISLCFFDHALGHDITFYTTTGIQLVCSATSVIIYAFIPFIYKRQVKRLTLLKEMGRAELIFLEEQQRVLITLGLSSIFTFVLMVLPTITRLVMLTSKYEPFPYAGLWMNMNPIVNTFLFVLRHKRFRIAFISLIKRKPLPEYIKNSNLRSQELLFRKTLVPPIVSDHVSLVNVTYFERF